MYVWLGVRANQVEKNEEDKEQETMTTKENMYDACNRVMTYTAMVIKAIC